MRRSIRGRSGPPARMPTSSSRSTRRCFATESRHDVRRRGSVRRDPSPRRTRAARSRPHDRAFPYDGRSRVRARGPLPAQGRAAVAGHRARALRDMPAARVGHRSRERRGDGAGRGRDRALRGAHRGRTDPRGGRARKRCGGRRARGREAARRVGNRSERGRASDAHHARMTAVRTTCPYCGVGCGIVAARPKAGGSTVVITGDANHPANAGRLCSKGAALAETLGPEGRLLYPEIHGRRVTWDDALDVVASRFAATIAEHGRDSVAFYVSGQLLTEDYYVANKLMKGFIGSANIDTNSRLCMASAVAGHKRAFGEDVVPAAYADLDAAELFVIVGSNMAWCHPILFQRVRRAKEERPHVRVVVIDPRRTATADVADVFLPIRPGTDAVLFNGLLSYMRREDALDWEYIDAHVDGASAALRAAKASSPSVPSVAAACGVPEHDVAEFYRLFVRTPQVVTLFSQGVNQSSSGTDKVNAILNVHLASGRIGREGAGPFSITGQPNAMGGREVGALANQLAAHMDFSPDHVERVARFWRAPHIATRPGLRAVELFDAVHA